VSNILTVLRRELANYFTSPIGYIYMIAFLLVTNILGLMIANPFFLYPVADMRTYFHVVAGVSTIFIAAISMRLWAEERKENTFEMLLTFPMKSSELVAGKFFASFVFYMIALVGTLTVPVMMAVVSQSAGSDDMAGTGFWGLLDVGPVISGYIGVLLLGGMMLAIGMFISSLCRDQIVAFVITAPVLFGSYIIGLPFVRMALDSALAPFQFIFTWLSELMQYPTSGAGAFIGDFIGIFVHYDNLTRGLLGSSDVAFFVVWIIALVAICAFWISQRGQSGRAMSAVLVLVAFCVPVLVNLFLFDKQIGGQLDLTEDQLYTVSPISGEILKNIKDDSDIKVTYYVSRKDKMPQELQNLERDVTDKLMTLQAASGGRLKVSVVSSLEASKALSDPFSKEDEDKDKDSVERQLLKKVPPFQVQVPREDQITTQLIYSGIEIKFGTKESEIIPQVVPQLLPKLEYMLINKIYRLTREDKPVIALIAPESKLDIPPQLAALYRQMGQQVPESEDPYEMVQKLLEYENYTVNRVKLTQESPLPDKYDVLVLLEPKNLNDRQQWEVSRALASGKPAFIAVQAYEFDYQVKGRGMSVTKKDLTPNINPILQQTGVTVDDRVLMDVDAVPLSMGSGMFGQSQPYTLPMHIMVKSTGMNQESELTRSLTGIFYLWGSALSVDKDAIGKNGLNVQTLFKSGPRSWVRVTAPQLVKEDIDKPKSASELKSFPLAVMIEGQIPYAYTDKPRPEWAVEPQANPMQPPAEPKPETTPDPGNPALAPGKLILTASATPYRKDFFQGDGATFLKGCIDALALGDIGLKINALGNKTAKVRTIGKLTDMSSTFWKAVHIVLVYLVIAVMGIVMFIHRRSRRNAYAQMVR